MRQSLLQTILYRNGRLKPGWRLCLFFFFFISISIAGQLAVSVLPRDPLRWGYQIVSLLSAVLAGGIVLSRVDGRPIGALGFALHRKTLSEVFVGLVVGVVLIGVAMLLLVVTGSAAFVTDTGSWGDYIFYLGWTLLFFGFAAAWEEAIFRGYPFQVLVEWIGPWPATLLASFIFAYLHSQNPSVTTLALINIFLAGILLSIAYLKTRSLWFATGVHLGWNWTMASVFDFPVSGLGFDTPLYSGAPVGEQWWTGGAFGPEAGVAETIAIVAGTLLVLTSRKIKQAPQMAALGPIVDRRILAEPS